MRSIKSLGSVESLESPIKVNKPIFNIHFIENKYNAAFLSFLTVFGTFTFVNVTSTRNGNESLLIALPYLAGTALLGVLSNKFFREYCK